MHVYILICAYICKKKIDTEWVYTFYFKFSFKFICNANFKFKFNLTILNLKIYPGDNKLGSKNS